MCGLIQLLCTSNYKNSYPMKFQLYDFNDFNRILLENNLEKIKIELLKIEK